MDGAVFCARGGGRVGTDGSGKAGRLMTCGGWDSMVGKSAGTVCCSFGCSSVGWGGFSVESCGELVEPTVCAESSVLVVVVVVTGASTFAVSSARTTGGSVVSSATRVMVGGGVCSAGPSMVGVDVVVEGGSGGGSVVAAAVSTDDSNKHPGGSVNH